MSNLQEVEKELRRQCEIRNLPYGDMTYLFNSLLEEIEGEIELITDPNKAIEQAIAIIGKYKMK